jgi:hypothetical protein
MAKSASRDLSRTDVIFAAMAVATMLVPLVLVTIFSENEYVQLVLGGRRILVFWAIVIPALFFLEKKLNPKT